MFDERVCVENLKYIVSESSDDQHIKNLSLDELRPTYTEITDKLYRISVFNCHTYKNMLWNFDNLRPEIRSNFQKALFNAWHPVYLKSMKTQRPSDHREGKKQELSTSMGKEKPREVDIQEQTSVMVSEHAFEYEKEKTIVSDKGADSIREQEPVQKKAPITAPKASAHKFEDDWFDKLLDFFAAIIGYVSGIWVR